MHMRARGFSLLEVLMASSIFLLGAAGLTTLISNISLITRKGVMNVQMTQVARDELRSRVTGATYPVAAGATTATVQISGVAVHLDIDTFDTGGVAGAELPAQLPGCVNLGYPSQCVRVRATDSVRACASNVECPTNACVNGICLGPSGQYEVEAYVIQP